jgi:O-acetyl-ADP-ribose deacetylase (regulator of RNase III)
MIEITTGNLLDADAEALVNTVNAVGVMGKGIALQFKQAFPDNFKAYEAACRRDEVQPGRMFVFHRNTFANPKVIINFPTKRHWKGKARIEDIEAGLRDLARVIEGENIRSVAVPPLGCGFGGLKWSDVEPRIERALGRLEARVILFSPKGAPQAEQMKVRTERPAMTATRAAVLELMKRYAVPGYRLTLLEIQKLAYFLQVAGEPLKLRFEKQKYGPYAEKLHHVLQRLEGHFIRGYGDRSRSVSVTLMPSALEESESFLQNCGETHQRLDRVSHLIKGLETPYGMELLSTVHWIASEEDPEAREDSSRAIDGVQKWSEYKRRTFVPRHIELAWKRLKAQNWI